MDMQKLKSAAMKLEMPEDMRIRITERLEQSQESCTEVAETVPIPRLRQKLGTAAIAAGFMALILGSGFYVAQRGGIPTVSDGVTGHLPEAAILNRRPHDTSTAYTLSDEALFDGCQTTLQMLFDASFFAAEIEVTGTSGGQDCTYAAFNVLTLFKGEHTGEELVVSGSPGDPSHLPAAGDHLVVFCQEGTAPDGTACLFQTANAVSIYTVDDSSVRISIPAQDDTFTNDLLATVGGDMTASRDAETEMTVNHMTLDKTRFMQAMAKMQYITEERIRAEVNVAEVQNEIDQIDAMECWWDTQSPLLDGAITDKAALTLYGNSLPAEGVFIPEENRERIKEILGDLALYQLASSWDGTIAIPDGEYVTLTMASSQGTYNLRFYLEGTAVLFTDPDGKETPLRSEPELVKELQDVAGIKETDLNFSYDEGENTDVNISYAEDEDADA